MERTGSNGSTPPRGTSCPPVFDADTGQPVVTGEAFPLGRVPGPVMMRRDVVVAGALGVAVGVGIALTVLYLCNNKKH